MPGRERRDRAAGKLRPWRGAELRGVCSGYRRRHPALCKALTRVRSSALAERQHCACSFSVDRERCEPSWFSHAGNTVHEDRDALIFARRPKRIMEFRHLPLAPDEGHLRRRKLQPWNFRSMRAETPQHFATGWSCFRIATQEAQAKLV